MANYPSLEFPITNAECAEIEAIFIELMRARDAAAEAPPEIEISKKPTSNPPLSAQDL
jgi:hypothetical protein